MSEASTMSLTRLTKPLMPVNGVSQIPTTGTPLTSRRRPWMMPMPETSGTKKKVIREGGRGPYFHTNHCVDDEMVSTCKILPGSTTLQRYATLGEMAKKALPGDMQTMFNALEPVGLKQNPTNPHDVATCGALVMDIGARNAMACVGIPGPDADSIVVELR